MNNLNKQIAAGKPQESPAGLISVFQRFWPFLWQRKRQLGGSYSLGLIAAGMVVLTPWPLKFIIDNVLGNHPFPAFFGNIVQGLSSEMMIILLGISVIFIRVAGTLASSTEKILNAQIREHVGVEIRDHLLNHLQTLPLTLRQSHRSGDLVLRLIDDVIQVVRLFTKTLPKIFRMGADVFLAFAVMFWMDPRLAGFSALILLSLGFLTRRYAGPLQNASRQKRRREGKTSGLAQEIIRGLSTIQVLGIEKAVRKRFKKSNRKSLNAGLDELRVAVSMERILQIISGILIGLVVGGGGILVLKSQITVGELTVFAVYVSQLLRPVKRINTLALGISQAVARGEKLISLLDQHSDDPMPSDTAEKISFDKPSTGLLELRGVTFAYPTSNSGPEPEPVLMDLDLKLERGQLAVLTGASGSGKTTLFNLLLRLVEPTSGEILLDKIPYKHLDLKSLRSQFAVMLQDTHLFAGSIRESLCPTDRKVDDGELWNALRLVGLQDHIRRLPEGLDAQLDEDGVNFSGGQRARLSLARAFLPDRPILLLDEPLANVDTESQKIILDALDQIHPTRTCLVITHQLSLLDRADVVLRLDSGQIVEISNFAL